MHYCNLNFLIQRAARIFIAVGALLLVAGCAASRRSDVLPSPEYALPPGNQGILHKQEREIHREYGDEVSKFHLLDRNDDGLKWRLALIDSAQFSLDLQYYLWYGDDSGLLLMHRVIAAANRGVKIRILIDDLDTILRDAETPELRDHPFAVIDAHPGIEIRLFNPWNTRFLIGRLFELADDMTRLNQRMHNKLLIADNLAAIIGGRNLGDEYLGLNRNFNFRDLDVLGVGPIARQSSAIFDRFWNSEWVMPVEDLQEPLTDQEIEKLSAQIADRLHGAETFKDTALDPVDWSREFESLSKDMSIGTSQTFSDTPDHDAIIHHMPDAIRSLFSSAKKELLITNAYIIPDEKAVERLEKLNRRNVRVRILTNSLATHDVPAVNSHYKQWRAPLIKAGVGLYEMRPDAKIRHEVADRPPVSSGFMGLHSKGIVVDRERVFIGSMNLDQRSFKINSEMGVLIYSPDLAGKLAGIMLRDMSPENSWEVTLSPDGELRWTSAEQEGADELGLRHDTLVHARGRTKGTRRRERTECEAAARTVATGLGGPRAICTIAVETHHDGAVTV